MPSRKKDRKDVDSEAWATKVPNIVYWSRLLLGVGVAFLCAVCNLTVVTASLFAITLYAATYYLLKLVIRLDLKILGGPRKLLTEGIGAYFLTWFMLWLLLYTLSQPPAP